VPAYGPQNDVTLKMPAFEWVHVQLHQQKGMISLSPPTICNSAHKTLSVSWSHYPSPFPNVSTMLTQLMYQKRWFL
ncbi:hypothetical protein ACV8U7_26470, partial [Citrobacter freundii]